jgi:transcription termination/antitermination protein NusG
MAAADNTKQWYIVQTFSGYENKAKIALEERIRANKAEDDFEEIYIPTETVVEMRNGKRRERQKKFYNGYIFVKMNLSDEAWHIVNNTPKIVGFVGGSDRKPTPVPESEVKKISDRIEEGTLTAEASYSYQKGDKIRVVEGNFKDFTGTIEEVQEDKEKLRVFVEIFGRPTSVEFDFDQVEIAEE